MWYDIKGYEGLYQINKRGEIFSLLTNKKRKLFKDKKGYSGLTFRKNGEGKRYRIHRLLAIQFISNPEDKPFINHIDGNPSNNALKNLEWSTQKENTRDGFKRGSFKKRDKLNSLRMLNKNPSRKLTDIDVLKIRELRKNGARVKDLASFYKISRMQIWNIVTKKHSGHL